MTESKRYVKREGSVFLELASLCAIILMCLLTITLSKEVRDGALYGMRVAALSVIPAVLPFMVLGDYTCYLIGKNGFFIDKTLSILYALPPSCSGALISGLLSGLPSGARLACAAYLDGKCDKEEATRLCAITNNPSGAFILGGVGSGMLGSQKLGLILYISVLSTSIVLSRFFRKPEKKPPITNDIIGQKFDFVSSVKGAGSSSVSIISFMALFGAFFEVIKKAALPELLLTIAATFLEIGGGCTYAVEFTDSTTILMLLLGFSLGFGGLCAHLQSYQFIKNASLSFKKYLALKLVGGSICATLSVILYNIWAVIF